MKLPALTRLHDGSFLSTAAGLPVRVIDAAVSITRTGQYRLIITLLDPDEAPAEHLLRLTTAGGRSRPPIAS